MKIEQLDSNFKPLDFSNESFKYYNAYELTIEGFPWISELKQYFRYSPKYEEVLNEILLSSSRMSAGGVVRFKTNSRKICLNAKFHTTLGMKHMPSSGADGFDLYIGVGDNMHLVKNFYPTENEILSDISTSGEMNDYCIYFPLYAGVNSVKIGFEINSVVEAATPHKIKLPFVFYGSSITQGGCASRPGICHTALISRHFDAPMVNFGHSGNAKGEAYMAKMISELPMSVFFLEYDYNAPTIEHLRNTHYEFYKIIRKNNLSIPIVLVSRVVAAVRNDSIERYRIIEETYKRAIANGDKNIYLINGMDLFGDAPPDGCTVDMCHPNDLGFYMMAKGMIKVIEKIIL